MSIKIEIYCEPGDVDKHMLALGFVKPGESSASRAARAADYLRDMEHLREWARGPEYEAGHEAFKKRAFGDLGRYMTDEENAAYNAAVEAAPEQETAEMADAAWDALNDPNTSAETKGAAVLAAMTTPTRKPGEPSPGKKRRNSAEVAEDEAYFAAQAATAPAQHQGDTPAISTGEERINPDDPQDVEDESGSDKLTHDDLRAAHKRYVDKFGMPAALRDFRLVIGAPIADIPGTQEALAEAIAKVDAAIGGGVVRVTDVASFAAETEAAAAAADSELFGAGETPKPEPRVYTKEDVKLAITAYAIKYDGESVNASKMVNALADIPRILAATFGEGVTNINAFEQTASEFQRASEAIDAAMKTNPYGRTAHQ